MKYLVTINCTLVENVEAEDDCEAEAIIRETARVGDCDIVWVGVERMDDEEEEAA